jgi:hypothetical protein
LLECIRARTTRAGRSFLQASLERAAWNKENFDEGGRIRIAGMQVNIELQSAQKNLHEGYFREDRNHLCRRDCSE